MRPRSSTPSTCESCRRSPDRHVLRRDAPPARRRARASSTDRRCCSSTSRRPASTRRLAPGCGTRSGALRELGTTVFLTTHYLEEADALCDRLAIIDHGRIVAEGTSDQLKQKVAGDVVTIGVERRRRRRSWRSSRRCRSSARPPTTRRPGSSGCTSTRARRAVPQLLRSLDAAGFAPTSISLNKPSLDDVFLRQTGRSLREEEAA